MNSRGACLLAATLLASACATSRAAAPVERPALEVPPVPPRIVEPAPPPETSMPEPVGELPPEKPATSTTRAKPPVSKDPVRDTQKPPEAKPVETPAPVEQPPAPAQITGTQIRTPATADSAAAEKVVRDTIGRAWERLKSIDYQRLPGGAQKAYDEAKDFIQRAEVALKASNLDLAKGLASQAAKLANELPSR
jgi:outer membrane biosynthesis protein TonB